MFFHQMYLCSGWQPDGLTIHAEKWFLGARFLGAPPVSLRPGDLFVLRDAGNTLAGRSNSVIGSIEYALAVLGTQLVVVTGHTNCGAVTTAVKAVIKGESLVQSLFKGCSSCSQFRMSRVFPQASPRQ